MFCGDGTHHIVLHRQHGKTLVASQRFRNLHLRHGAFFAIVGYAPAVSPLLALHRICQRSGKSYFWSAILLVRSNLQPTAFLPWHQPPPASAMATVDTAAQTRFWDIFSASTEDIQEGFSVGQATATDGHWTKWAYFCTRVALDHILVALQRPCPHTQRLR